METRMTLSALPVGKWGTLIQYNCSGHLQHRLENLGLIPGATLRCLFRSPAGSPIAYEISGTAIALRKRDAEQILVEAEP